METKTTTQRIAELLSKGYIEHHTSLCRGYMSRKGDGILEEYKGRFGVGYKHFSPAWHTTQYCWVTYYIKQMVK